MPKGLALYVMVFVLLMVAAWTLGNTDPITSAVVEARSETMAGAVTMDVLDQVLAFVMKLIAGATIAGILSFAWIHGGKMIRKAWADNLARRWKPGPNAMFQQQAPKLPRLSREDLILLALGNRSVQAGRVNTGRASTQEDENEINIDL